MSGVCRGISCYIKREKRDFDEGLNISGLK
jgi:hypothetical protein